MKALDFNSLIKPTWKITLKDENKTTINILTPEIELIDRLTAVEPELQKANANAVLLRQTFDLCAELMSHNEEKIAFTGEELINTYKLTFADLLCFFSGYYDFISEIKQAKN